MGLTRIVAVLLGAAALVAGAAAGSSLGGSPAYLLAHQAPSGGFAEDGRQPDAPLTAWAALALVASGGSGAERGRAGDYLTAHLGEARTDADLALAVVALAALGRPVDSGTLDRLAAHVPDVLVNETVWCVLALRAAGAEAPAPLVRAILAAQAKGGGFPWSRGGQPDSNDTAAAIQALRAAGVSGAPIRRAAAALRGFQARSGGFALVKGREPDAQSTAWGIQGLLAAGQAPGKPAVRFLARLRRADGSYGYSVRYATTPVWVTAQVVPALAGKPFPLR